MAQASRPPTRHVAGNEAVRVFLAQRLPTVSAQRLGQVRRADVF